MPDFSRLSPLQGLGRMFSTHSLVELGKAIAKSLLVGGVGGLDGVAQAARGHRR